MDPLIHIYRHTMMGNTMMHTSNIRYWRILMNKMPSFFTSYWQAELSVNLLNNPDNEII